MSGIFKKSNVLAVKEITGVRYGKKLTKTRKPNYIISKNTLIELKSLSQNDFEKSGSKNLYIVTTIGLLKIFKNPDIFTNNVGSPTNRHDYQTIRLAWAQKHINRVTKKYKLTENELLTFASYIGSIITKSKNCESEVKELVAQFKKQSFGAWIKNKERVIANEHN